MTGLHWLLVVALLASGGGLAQPADALDTVRALYASADYEAALAAIERLPSGEGSTEVIEIRRYRALCLIALGRTEDAEQVIEQVVGLDPAYQPDEQEPPRVRSAYAAVRARVLPQVARSSYVEAKTAYDRREWEEATAGFIRTIALLDGLESADPTVADLRTLASGFLDLSRASATPSASPADPIAPADTAETAPEADGPATPPVVIEQTLPPWNPAAFGSQFQTEFRGAVEVTIDERGAVAAARIVEPVHPLYDVQLLEAARAWRYDPARRGGQPVGSVKRVDIVLRPR